MDKQVTCSRCGKMVAEKAATVLCPECQPKAGGGGARAVQAETGRAAAVAFVLLYVGYVSYMLATSSQLPQRVATHFGGEGRANGWMSRPGYLVFEAVFPLAVGLFMAGLSGLIRRFPARYVNLPRKDFWLAPERLALTTGILRSRLVWLACLMTLFFWGLHVLTVEANRVHPAQLPMGGMLGVVIAFLTAVMIWVALLLMRFAETGEQRPTPNAQL